MLNHIVLMGRLTRDPELRQTQSGNSVVSFTLACDRDFAAQGAVDEVHIEPCAHSVCQQIVLLGLVSGCVERAEDRSVQSALFAQRLQNRVCHARRVEDAVDIAAVDIAGAGERRQLRLASSHVNFVAGIGKTVQPGKKPRNAGKDALRLRLDLFAVEDRVHGKKPHAADLRDARRFHAAGSETDCPSI